MHPHVISSSSNAHHTARKTAVALVVSFVVAATLVHAVAAGAAISAPTPIEPSDGGTLSFPTEPPLFQWLPVEGAKSYRIEIDDAPDFIGASSASTVNTAYTLTEPQTIGQPFYWRVQATSAAGAVSDWSPTWSYEIAWPDSSPILVEPTLGDGVEDVVFRWEPVAGASTYQIQVSPNADWSNNVVVDAVVMGTSYSRPTTLDNASYFWRVRARDAASPAEPRRMVRGRSVHSRVARRPGTARARRTRSRPRWRPRASPGARSPTPRTTRCSSVTT